MRILITGGLGQLGRALQAVLDNHTLTIVDLPDTLKAAEKGISARGLSDRISFFAADMLQPGNELPKGFDAIWMSQFLDCFSEEEIHSILTRAKNAMHENSYLYILELFWDRQKYEASSYSLNATSLYFTAVANGNSRMYHSSDFFRMIEKAGLAVEEAIDQIGISHTLLKCYKR